MGYTVTLPGNNLQVKNAPLENNFPLQTNTGFSTSMLVPGRVSLLLHPSCDSCHSGVASIGSDRRERWGQTANRGHQRRLSRNHTGGVKLDQTPRAPAVQILTPPSHPTKILSTRKCLRSKDSKEMQQSIQQGIYSQPGTRGCGEYWSRVLVVLIISPVFSIRFSKKHVLLLYKA